MLDASLSATAADEGVRLALTVTNVGDDPVALTFPTGQRVEFTAYESDADRGSRVWRYGEGRLFTQAFGTETLAPSSSRTYRTTWPNPAPGSYRIVGDVVAEDVDASAAATVSVDEK